MSNNSLSIFQFQSFQIRVVLIDGEPWFVAADVCLILGLNNVSQALTRLEPDEKDTITLNDGTTGNPDKLVVSESGLYALVLSSRKREAKPFRRWVTSEVLPAIRKTGSYSISQPKQISQAEALLQSVQLIVELEQKIQRIESVATEAVNRVAQIEASKQEAIEELTQLPLSPIAAPELTTRSKVNMLVKNKGKRDLIAYNTIWNKLYQELYYRASYDVKARCRHSGLKCIEQIEKDDMMDALYAIASEVLT